MKVFLGQKLDAKELEDSLGQFHQYFHLCNSQMFLRVQRRVSAPTWLMWARGIEANFELPAFQQAWEFIHTESTKNRLEYLARFLDRGFDPKVEGQIV